MPLNEIPRHFNPETRNLIEAALEDAWQELNKDSDHHMAIDQSGNCRAASGSLKRSSKSL